MALLGAIFYLIHDIIVKTNLFLIAGLIRQLRGTMNMNKLGGIYAEYPKISLLIALVLFSLAGIPPLSGFWPKIYLIEAAFFSENYFFIVSIIIGSFITLYVLAKFWAEVFWKNASTDEVIVDSFKPLKYYKKVLLVLPIGILGLTTLYIGLNAEMIIQVAEKISSEMLDTKPYIKAVLGK